ncbi:MAG: TnpV protein [Erysipelotrichales bacterium]|nr:TnpV protein [Erysipelotrichales bacterium]
MKEIKYVEIDGILYPDLKLTPQKEIHLSRFGRMKLKYLKEHRRVQYTNLLISGYLNNYLQEFDNEMNELYDRLVEQYKVKWNITEELKANDQMKWVQEMNNIESIVKELIIKEFIRV